MLIEKDRPLTWFEKYVLVPFESIQVIGGALALVGGFLFVLQATFRYGTKTFWYLGQVMGRKSAELVLVCLVLVVAAIAYELKQRRPASYGLIEIGFGLGSTTNIAFSMVPGSSTLPQWVGLFGCTYIFVRRLTNVTEAVESRFKNIKAAEPHLQPKSPVEPPSDKSQMLNLENRIRASEKWTIWLTGAIAFFGLCSAAVAGLQWTVMQGQLNEMKAGTVLSQQSSQAASDAVRLSQDAAKDNERYFRIQNRPYVTVDVLEQVTALQPGESRIKLTAHNSGRTPALRLKILSHVFIGGKMLPLNSVHRSESIIASDKEAANGYTLALSESDVKLVMSGTEFVVKGTIKYTDIFKQWHDTTFCARYFLRDNLYKYCETGNDVE